MGVLLLSDYKSLMFQLCRGIKIIADRKGTAFFFSADYSE